MSLQKMDTRTISYVLDGEETKVVPHKNLKLTLKTELRSRKNTSMVEAQSLQFLTG